ncbi:acyltransferase [Paenibacillus sp.]|uniref:acyltransferase n=1 Tax=Paenibacillus sp. TaxID=58172 RepID=UPI002D3E42E5|nr:acyltransferase [Paenibacillus sp.]HZG84216.1 acyltransferase [Paenibacillus sp.]
MNKENIEEITLLRALAFLAIATQHTIGEFIYRPDIHQPDAVMLAMLFHMTRFGTPAFVFMAGALLFYRASEGRSYGSFLSKRAGDILVPFLAWTAIYWATAMMYAGRSLAEPAAWLDLARQLIEPTYGYHLWFILMIFQFYLLFPLLRKAAEPLRRFATRRPGREAVRTAWLLTAAGALYLALVYYSYWHAGAFAAAVGGAWEWAMAHRTMWFVFYFFYFLLGAVCAMALHRFREAAVSLLPVSLFAFAACYIWAGYALLDASMETMKLGASTYLRPVIFLLALSQLAAGFGVTVLVVRRGGWLKRALLAVGRLSFGAFLAHPLVLTGVAFLTRPLDLGGYHLPVAVASSAVVAAGALLIARLAGRLPFGWLLVGAQGRRRPRRGAAGVPAANGGTSAGM